MSIFGKKSLTAGLEKSPEYYDNQAEARKRSEMREQEKKPVTQGELAEIQENINKIIEDQVQDQKTITELKEEINALFENKEG